MKLKYLFLLLSLSLFYANQSSACELIVNDFFNEIKMHTGDSKITESNGGFYVDSSLLSLQEDGIHLIYGEKDFLVPFAHHDAKGYFLPPQACWYLGREWLCCQCNHKNEISEYTCKVCLRKRCKVLK